MSHAKRVEAFLRRAPRPVKRVADLASPAYDAYSIPRFRRRTGSREPIPPIRMRVAVGHGANIDWYLESGRRVAGRIVSEAEDLGRPFDSLEAVFDFACGCGRVLQHLAPRPPRLTACDVDRRAVEWVGRNLSVDAIWTRPTPPLPFDENSFDFVYTISSFTHLSAPDQDLWLGELTRVLRPGGLLLATTHGSLSLERFQAQRNLPGELLDRLSAHDLEREGFIFEPYTKSVASAGAFTQTPSVYGLSFHTHDYIREHWGRKLAIERTYDAASGSASEFVGQDLVAASKRT